MVVSMQRWKGKVAIVTGASAGIGAAIATSLVNEGLIVAGFARRKEKLDEMAAKLKGKPGQFHGVKADMSQEQDVLAAFQWVKKHLGPVHILVNNAGFMKNTTLLDGDVQMWKDTFDVNVIGLCLATREAIKSMQENKVDGHIIHIGSVVGHRVIFFPNCNVYGSSKFAVRALTEQLRLELNAAGSKIKISEISPGIVSSEFREAGNMATSKEQEEYYKQLPQLQSEDIADAAVYVLSTPPHVQVHELMIQPVGQPM